MEFGSLFIFEVVFLKKGTVSDVCGYFRDQRWTYFSFINVCVGIFITCIYTDQNIDVFAAPKHAYKFSTVRDFSNDSYISH